MLKILKDMRNELNILEKNRSSQKYIRPKLRTNAPLPINSVGIMVVAHTMENIVEPTEEKTDTKTKPHLIMK